MNLAIFSPKKNQCVGFKTKNVQEEEYNSHILNKGEIRNKGQRKIPPSKICTMDMHLFLLCLKSNISALYYRTKLIVYNFIIFDLQTHDGYWLMWHKSELFS